MKQYLFLIAVFLCNAALCQQSITDLRCEHLSAPLGVDMQNLRLSWQIKGFDRQVAYQLFISTDSAEVANGHTNLWRSSRKESSELIANYEGPALRPFTRYYWSVVLWDENSHSYKSPVTWFETGMMEETNWKGDWISDGHHINQQRSASFIRSFPVNKKIRSARAYIAAGGLYELSINNSKAGNERLNPMFTRFDRRTLYVSHDITPLIRTGSNTVAIALGNGWFNHQPPAVWYFHEAPWRARPRFCMDIRIVYEDGSTEIISTEKSWKYFFNGIMRNNIYTGEVHDARKMYNSLSVPDSLLKDVYVIAAPSSRIVSQLMQPVRDVDTILPVKLKRYNDQTYVYDLGRNFSGIAELTLKGKAGTLIKLRYAERLDSNGRVDQSNIDYHYRPRPDSDPFQEDEFILSGKDDEIFRPLFNYKGFQYIEIISDQPVTLEKNNLKAFFMHSDVAVTGKISSSNPLLDKIWAAANSSYLSNLFGYPTDCPQREKNGWTGDAHIAIETGLYNFDAITVYEKWIEDHKDAQQPNGVFPAIIPTADWGYNWANGPDWTSTIAIIPWNIYLFYGDKHLLEEAYDPMQRYVDYITKISRDDLTDWGLGDWIPIKSVANKELTTSIYYYVDVNILAKTASLLGKTDDAEKYSLLAEKIRTAINRKFLNNETGIYASGFQTELSMPLFWGIVPTALKNRVADNLAKKIEADGQMDVGLLGSKAILNALSENGYADLAYQLASKDTYPSWGWWIKNGATTLYENWRIEGASDISMNHIMFGEINAWMYKGLGGIFPDENNPGFRHIRLQPNFVKGLNEFEARHLAPSGWIISKWKKSKSVVIYEVEIPSNSTATVYLPGDAGKGQLLNPGKHKFTIKNTSR